MLSIDKSTEYQRSILGTFSEHPEMAWKNYKLLNISIFTSAYRQQLFKRVFDEAKNKKRITVQSLWGGMMDTEDQKNEMIKIISLSNPLNLLSYIDDLLIDNAVSKFYTMGQKIQDMVVTGSTVFQLETYISNELVNLMPNSHDDFTSSLSNTVDEIKKKTIHNEKYPIGVDKWDKITPVTPRAIFMIAGNEGTFKTKFMIWLSRMLLSKHKNISINWYSMEDPRDKLLRGYISQSMLLSEQELLAIENYIDFLPADVIKYDIEFVNKSSSIKEIGEGFKKFRNKREGRFSILIVDNIMKILPVNAKRDLDIDSEITREIDSWNIKTDNKEASVFLLHHFTKEAISDKNEFRGFEPNIGMMRGGGRYKDLATTVLLFNAMYSHVRIVRLFNNHKDFMEKLLIIHVAKNRNEEKTTYKFIAYAAYNLFFLI